MILLDTNVLVDLNLYRLDPEETYAASILSRAELEFGIVAAPTSGLGAERMRRLYMLDATLEWIEFDLESTRSYGIVAAGARASGARVRSKDALIAAQAHRHGVAVMTANVADFRIFDDFITVIEPTRDRQAAPARP